MSKDIIIYNTEDGKARINLKYEDGTVWLNQNEIAELFQTTKQNISKHIKAIFADAELDEISTVNYKLTVQKEGQREVSREFAYYNLDMILAIGYRVRSNHRIDSEKEFMGLSTFQGDLPSLSDAKIAKNYLSEKELKGLNALVSGYLDFAERQASREIPMTMKDWVHHVDKILTASGENLLKDSGKISRKRMEEKVKTEYVKYSEHTLTQVEKDYLNEIKAIETLAKKGDKHE